MSGVFKALGHPARREIVAMLRHGPLTSGEIAAAFEMSWPSVSGHLRALRDAELVECERAGTSVRYRLNISALEEAVGFLLGVMDSVATAPDLDGGLAAEGAT